MTQEKTKQKPRFTRQRSAITTIAQCNDCKSTDIKSRTNYSHGSKSKSTTSYTCNNCNSGNVQVSKQKGRY